MTTNFFPICKHGECYDNHTNYTGPRLSERQSLAALLDTQTELNLNKLLVAWDTECSPDDEPDEERDDDMAAWDIEYSPGYKPDEMVVLRVLEVLEILQTNTSIRVLHLGNYHGSYRNCYPLPSCARSMQGLICMLAHNTAIHTLITWDLGNQPDGGAENARALMSALADNTRIRTLTITCHIYSSRYRKFKADVDIIFNAIAEMIAANRTVDDFTLSCTPWYANKDNRTTTRFAKILAPALCNNSSLQRLTLYHQNASVLFTDEPCFLEFSCISYLHLRFEPSLHHHSDYNDPRADGFKHSVAAAVARVAEKGALSLDDLDGVVDLRNHLEVLGLDGGDGGDGAEFSDNAAVLAALKPMYMLK